jgi:hypothetical protein
VESPHNNDANVNVATEIRKTGLLPNRMLNFALSGSITTNPNEYAVNVHPAQLTEVFKSICKVCKAVATMVESTVIINKAIATMGNTILGFTCSYLLSIIFSFSLINIASFL